MCRAVFFEQIRYLNTRDIAGNRFEWAPVLNGRVRLGIPSVDMRHAALLENHEHILRGSFSPRGRPRPISQGGQLNCS
jgi:hypothetical protein